HLRKEVGAMILKIAYGYTIETHERDPLVDPADEAMAIFSLAILPGTWAVVASENTSRSGFRELDSHERRKSLARPLRHSLKIPYAFVQHKMAQQDFEPSFLSNSLQESSNRLEQGSDEESMIKWSAAAMYAAGTDTVYFPTKAQAEIDRVVGPNHLPSFEVRENLPYIDAKIEEALRWHPVLPMGQAHASTKDDV
ncbi:hypothetical protein BBP40_011234, partial [Aspergillus hancockii]